MYGTDPIKTVRRYKYLTKQLLNSTITLAIQTYNNFVMNKIVMVGYNLTLDDS